MNINQKVTRFALCLGAFVAICSPPSADLRHFAAKHLRRQDAKMNINQKVTRFALCLGAFVAICSPPSADPG
jgi:hypothetical protein